MPPHTHQVVRGKEIAADLDLGAEGRTLGDVQTFGATFTEGGANLGFELGVCQLVALPDPVTGRDELWQCVVTHKWNDGDLTVQFVQDYTQPTPWYFAITGGTRNYIGARGQVTYIDANHITFKFRSIAPVP